MSDKKLQMNTPLQPSTCNNLNLGKCPAKQTVTSPPFDLSQTGNHLNIGKTFPNVVQNGPHHVDAQAYGKIPLTQQTPPGVGGGLQYRHDFGHSASVNVDHVKDWGTTVQAQANARLFQSRDRTANLDLGAGARQHFGPRPSPMQGQVMLGFTKKF